MSKFITRYFERQLAKLSYPTDQVRYSLGYTQGDGMAFYGSLDSDESKALADRLLKGPKKAAAKRAIDKDCRLAIRKHFGSGNYHHYNTMNVEFETPLYEGLTAYEESAFLILAEVVQVDVVEVSQKLEQEGYRIHEAGSEVWALADRTQAFKTARFEVKIEEMEDPDFDIEYFDEELIESVYAGFVSEENRYFTLCVTVTAKESGIELGSSCLGGCVESNKTPDRTYSGERRQLVAEAIAEARKAIQSMQLAA